MIAKDLYVAFLLHSFHKNYCALFFNRWQKQNKKTQFFCSTCSHSRQSLGPCWLGSRTFGSRCEPRWLLAAGEREPPPPSPWSDWALSGCASEPSWSAGALWRGSPEGEKTSKGKSENFFKWKQAFTYISFFVLRIRMYDNATFGLEEAKERHQLRLCIGDNYEALITCMLVSSNLMSNLEVDKNYTSVIMCM